MMAVHPTHSHDGPYREGESTVAIIGLAKWLYLAATPTFAIMALLTALGGNPIEGLCSCGREGPLNGMVMMYALMTVFHSRPWLNLIAGKPVEQGR